MEIPVLNKDLHLPKPEGEDSDLLANLLLPFAIVAKQEPFYKTKPIPTPNPEYSRLASDIEYLEDVMTWSKNKFGRVSPKLFAQHMLKHAGVGDKDTAITRPQDHDRANAIVNSFLDNYRAPIWVGTSILNDMVDENAPVRDREQAKLFRNIYTLEDWRQAQGEIEAYGKRHPELVLKIFPQDGDYSIGRMVAGDNELVIQVRLNQMMGRDVVAAKKLVTINIFESPYLNKVSVVSDDAEAYEVMGKLTSSTSIRKFKALEREMWRLPKNLSVLNPEFMLDDNIAFFTDFVWGTDKKNTETSVVSISKLLEIAARSPVISRQHYQEKTASIQV